MRYSFVPFLSAVLLAVSCQTKAPVPTADSRSPQEILFDDGNYAMFIHFGLYSSLEGVWKGKIYYGNAEWIMNSAQADIPVDEYKALAASFNPSEFDADEIVSIAKDAGMKYIIITSKHHEGFAMFDTAASDFDIVDATPLKRDLMAELAEACHREGLGIGFYYSQFQDWTAPGGGYGPSRDASGREVSFDEYFRTKCVPQVEELTTKYGDIQLIWFDTPGNMPAKYSKELVDIVRTLVSTIARGGTWMLNVGPDSKGRIHPMAAAALRKSGKWVHAHPEAVYGAGPSPWGHALPWGEDAVTQGDKIELVVYDWPSDGNLWVPGLKTPAKSVRSGGRKLRFTSEDGWLRIRVPFERPDEYASVIELTFDSDKEPEVDGTLVADPSLATVLPVEFASVSGCEVKSSGWMEKFGEWKTRNVAQGLNEESRVSWTVKVKDPGVYNIDLEYLGLVPEGWVEWRMDLDGKEVVVNEHDATRKYAWYPLGWVEIASPGVHTFTLRATDGDIPSARVAAMRLTPVPL